MSLSKTKPLIIDYYTDVLCVWAWIAQRRVDELNQNYDQEIEFHNFYVNVFGDVTTKMKDNWNSKGGYKAFAEHVNQSALNYDHAVIHKDVWVKTRPTTSANAHLILKAIEITQGSLECANFALIIRNAFYKDALDISNFDVLYGLIEQQPLDLQKIKESVNNGTAIAKLMNDYQRANNLNIKGSPSYVMDGGRQVLFGNVGYRVLNANIQELIRHPSKEASWC